MNKINGFLVALVIVVGGLFGGGLGYSNYAAKNVIIESSTGATNVGKVTSEVLTYRMKVLATSDPSKPDSTQFMELGVITPSEFIVPFLEKALGDNFSYDATVALSVVLVIETYVVYVGDKGSAQKLVDSRSLVFHNGTTIKEMVADVTQHTKNVNALYKKEHSYIQ